VPLFVRDSTRKRRQNIRSSKKKRRRKSLKGNTTRCSALQVDIGDMFRTIWVSRNPGLEGLKHSEAVNGIYSRRDILRRQKRLAGRSRFELITALLIVSGEEEGYASEDYEQLALR